MRSLERGMKGATGNKMKKKSKSGFSLVEIMVSMLILSVLALGGAMVLYHTGAVIQKQKLKRLAVDEAVERLEMVKRTKYAIMRPAVANTVYYFIDQDNDNLLESGELQSTQISETPPNQFPMVTTIQRIPPPSAVESEYLLVGVSVTYDRVQQVKLGSIIVP